MADSGAIMHWKRPRGNQPDLETVLEFVADSLVEPFRGGVVHYTITGGDSRANLDRWLSLMRKGWEACVILNRLRSCCKDMDTLVAPALARSGVCGPFAHLRHNEWLVAYGRVKPTRYPSRQIEFFTNKRSWPHGLVRLKAPHKLWVFHPRVGEVKPCSVSETDEISSNECEDSSESEET